MAFPSTGRASVRRNQNPTSTDVVLDRSSDRGRILSEVTPVKVLHFAALALLSVPAFAVDTPPPTHITPNATVYVAPQDDGFDTDLKAAILKKHVPLVMTDDKDKAEYVIKDRKSVV